MSNTIFIRSTPIWDGPSRRVVDLEIIPLSVLERPRVDVTLRISGMFRDAFPQLVKLTSKAINLVSNLNEDDKFNPLAGALRMVIQLIVYLGQRQVHMELVYKN